MVRDTVCGMQVDERRAAGKSRYQGHPYYFCSRACKERFDRSPERYAGVARGEKALELYDHLRLLMKRLYASASVGGADRGLTPLALFAIESLGRRGVSKMSKLAEECGAPLSTMTGVTDSLVRRGYAKRERIEEDRRVILVTLTAKGSEVYQERLEADMKLVLSMMEALEPSEQDSLLDGLRKVNWRTGP